MSTHQKHAKRIKELADDLVLEADKSDRDFKAAQVRFRSIALALIKTAKKARADSLDKTKSL